LAKRGFVLFKGIGERPERRFSITLEDMKSPGARFGRIRPFEEPHTVSFHEDMVKWARLGAIPRFERTIYA
jgi:hypothetical protein